MLPKPHKLFLECLKHPEPLIDEAYCRDELIISKRNNEKTFKSEDIVLPKQKITG